LDTARKDIVELILVAGQNCVQARAGSPLVDWLGIQAGARLVRRIPRPAGIVNRQRTDVTGDLLALLRRQP
jgi:hypothetical protein